MIFFIFFFAELTCQFKKRTTLPSLHTRACHRDAFCQPIRHATMYYDVWNYQQYNVIESYDIHYIHWTLGTICSAVNLNMTIVTSITTRTKTHYTDRPTEIDVASYWCNSHNKTHFFIPIDWFKVDAFVIFAVYNSCKTLTEQCLFSSLLKYKDELEG